MANLRRKQAGRAVGGRQPDTLRSFELHCQFVQRLTKISGDGQAQRPVVRTRDRLHRRGGGGGSVVPAQGLAGCGNGSGDCEQRRDGRANESQHDGPMARCSGDAPQPECPVPEAGHSSDRSERFAGTHGATRGTGSRQFISDAAATRPTSPTARGAEVKGPAADLTGFCTWPATRPGKCGNLRAPPLSKTNGKSRWENDCARDNSGHQGIWSRGEIT